MAHDEGTEHLTEPHIEPVSHDIGLNATTLSFSLLAGLGIVLMILALAIGVITGNSADTTAAASNSSTITILFIAGLLALIAGAAAWIGVTQPFRNFDDINVPADDVAHGHEEAHSDETAIVVADEHALVIAEPETSQSHPTPAHSH
jgi:hypothetical protein